MFYRILKVDTIIYLGQSDSVTLPGSEGDMTVLRNHVPLITILKKGEITVKNENKRETFKINSGILEVSKGEITVLI